MSKWKSFALKEKCEMLAKYDDLPKCSWREMALKFKISYLIYAACLRTETIWAPSAKILANKLELQAGKANVEVALLDWLKNVNLKKTPTSCGILHEKAEKFTQLMDVNNFSASDGLLTRWKEQNNIVYHKLHGEKQGIDFDSTHYWKTDFY